MKRCDWCGNDDLYCRYHDEEWGRPTTDDTALFESLVLESAQAGLSWITILRKRENYRQAFSHFAPEKVARYNNRHIEKLLQDEGIVRHRAKIESSINNARQFLKVQENHGSFARYLWNFVDGTAIQNQRGSVRDIPSSTALSDQLSKDLKQRGFKFLGSTTCYAFLQAVGVVNDHLVDCHCYEPCSKAATVVV